jgi:hypothetical protein
MRVEKKVTEKVDLLADTTADEKVAMMVAEKVENLDGNLVV